MPRHPAGHGVDRVANGHTLVLQEVRHFAQRMLRLRDGHAVPGHDDHTRGIAHDEGGVVRVAALRRPVALISCGRIALLAKPAQDDGQERPVHGSAHDVGQDGPGAADQRPDDDQRGILQREADARRRPARVRVQHGDHDRHVRAANRNDQQDPDRQGEAGHDAEPDHVLVANKQRNQGDDRDPEQQVQWMLQREYRRRAADQPLKLEEGHNGAGECHRADDDSERHFDPAGKVDGTSGTDSVRIGREQCRPRDQHGRDSDEAVECRHELRHRLHFDAERDCCTDDGPASASHRRPAQLTHAGLQERGDDGDGHAGHTEQVSAPRAFGRRQPLQGEDEADRCAQVEQGSDIGSHERPRGSLRRNMPSMRCVTMNPPKMLTAARPVATTPSHCAVDSEPAAPTSSSGAIPSAMRAPTTMIPEMALVTDISGVCSAGVTDHTT